MGYECFDVSIDHKVAHVRFNRPEARNTLTRPGFRELREIIGTIDDDGSIRAMVLSSTGKTFCAGLDLGATDFGDTRIEDGARRRGNFVIRVSGVQETFTALERMRIPVLAAVQGGCVGGGLELISACDMRYCTAEAFFALPEINLGFPADLGGLQRLPRVMADGLARELAFTGRRLPADEALAAGLVNKVYATPDDMLEGVLGIAAEIATKSPLGIWGTKEFLLHARDHTVADGLRHAAVWQAGMVGGTDVKEGVQAFREKRSATYDDLPPKP
jgi:enoyl-CoA hydratase